MSEHREILIKKSKEDLESAQKLIQFDDFSEEIVLFHCQQAVEKILKAYLDYSKVIYPKTHDLEVLLSMCMEKDASFKEIKSITNFTPYAVEIRYDEFIETTKEEVAEIVSQTEEAVKFVAGKLN